MQPDIARPFESIESAHEFIVLLEESIAEAIADVKGHLRDSETSPDDSQATPDEKQIRALQLALLKLNQLGTHTGKSRRALNDLRSIRRLLFTERSLAEGA